MRLRASSTSARTCGSGSCSSGVSVEAGARSWPRAHAALARAEVFGEASAAVKSDADGDEGDGGGARDVIVRIGKPSREVRGQVEAGVACKREDGSRTVGGRARVGFANQHREAPLNGTAYGVGAESGIVDVDAVHAR